MKIQLPKIFENCPKVLVREFLYSYYNRGDTWCWYLRGGRVSGKTQTAVRLLLVEAKRGKKCAAGRITEKQKDSIKECIDVIQASEGNKCGVESYTRDYILMDNGNKIQLRGFNPSNPETARGFDGFDLVLIDEGQYGNSKYFRELRDTMRRHSGAALVICANLSEPTDPPGEFVNGAKGAVAIECNYVDNHMCPAATIADAEHDKVENYEYWLNNWMGRPLTAGDMAVWRAANLEGLEKEYVSEDWVEIVCSIDFAPGSDEAGVKTDPNVLTFMGINMLGQRKSLEVIDFIDTNPLAVVGRLVGEMRKRGIKYCMVDSTGAGELVAPLLEQQGFVVYKFHGEKKNFVPHGKQKSYLNNRAYAYFLAANCALEGKLTTRNKKVYDELRSQSFRYTTGGMRKLEPKAEIKKRLKHSPDFADSFVMGNLLCEILGLDFNSENDYYNKIAGDENSSISNRGYTDGFCGN